MTPRYLGVLIVLFALSQTSFAADNALYLSASGGWTTAAGGDIELTDTTAGGVPVLDKDLEIENGYSVHAAVGYDFGTPRVEAEFGYFANDIGSVTSGGRDLELSSAWRPAESQAISLMVNVLGDLPINDQVTLFAGGGLGLASIEIDSESESQDVRIEVDANSLAYQFLAGVSFTLTDHLDVVGLYRLWSALESDADWDAGSVSQDSDLAFPLLHSFELGLRYTF